MKQITEAALATLAITGSLWLFQDSLVAVMVEQDLIEKAALDAVVLTVGDTKPCKAEVNLQVWDEMMNQLDMYRWVVACEDALEKENTP